MKIAILFIMLSMVMSVAGADVYVVYKTDSREIVNISNENDCVVQDGMAVDILKGTELKDVHLSFSPVLYKYEGKKITPNMAKISEHENMKLDMYELEEEEKVIDARMRKLAMDSLKSEGYIFKHNSAKE